MNRHAAKTERCQQILLVREIHLAGDIFQPVAFRQLFPLVPQAFAIFFQRFAPFDDILFPLLLLEPVADFVPGLRRSDDIQPVATGRSLLRGNDFHNIAIVQLGFQRHHPAIDPGPDAPMPHVGVHPVCEVQRHRSRRQIQHVAFGCEDKHLIGKHVQFDRFDEFPRIAQFLMPFQQLPHPRQFLVKALTRSLGALLVLPVSSDAHLGDMVHFIRPDLDLQRFPLNADYGRVQGLIHVGFRYGDKILEPVGNRLPQGVDHSQRSIAFLERIDQDPYRRQIVNLTELFMISLHFAENAVKVLRPAVDLRLDADFLQLFPQNHDRFLDDGFPLLPLLPDLVHQFVILLRFQIAERQIFQFPFDVGYAQTVRQRRKNLHSFPGDLLLLLRRHRLKRSHIVKSVGQFDQNYPDVFRHRQKHLAIVFHLLFFFGLVLNPAQFGHTVD